MSPDALIADAFSADANTKEAPANDIPDGWEGLDIGSEGKKVFREHILGCKTILWNGPVGVFEIDKFATGSKEVAQAIAEATKNGAYSLIGGGDSVACINKFGLADQVSYISTGGGALLEYIEFGDLPGVAPSATNRAYRNNYNGEDFRFSRKSPFYQTPNDMKKIILFAATMACMTACQNTPKTPALDMANFDLSVAPNADFYEYATGGWQKNNPLKPEYARYGSFDILRDNNEKRINELFSGMTQQKAEPGSVEQKISDLYKMGLDSVRLNAEGAAPIKAAVDGILAIGDRSQLTAAVARLHSSIANPFFGVGVQSDLMNSDINALYASQPDLIMGDRDYYLDPENESICTAYKEIGAKSSGCRRFWRLTSTG